MSRSRTSVVLAFAALALLLPAQPAAAQSTPATAERARQLRLLLHEQLDTSAFQERNLTIKEALRLLQEKVNAKYKEDNLLPILVDEAAFRGENANVQELFEESPFRLNALPPRLPVATLLRLILGNTPGQKATFLIRQGSLEITTVKAASPKQLLQQTVVADFDKRPLKQVLEELSERTGLSVILDVRVGAKAKIMISATLGNDITLEGALRHFADMAGLQLVVTHTAAYITTPANAQLLMRGEKEGAVRSGSEARPPGVAGPVRSGLRRSVSRERR